MFFGDSLVDVGNNDYIHTIVKANLPPYGRDFEGNVATGRFCNGMLLSDMIGWSHVFCTCSCVTLSLIDRYLWLPFDIFRSLNTVVCSSIFMGFR
jgi:hypothetical protein